MPHTLVKHFGKYIADKKLGQGGMAEVYKGHSKNVFGVNKTVAIKVMSSKASQDPKYVEMFKQEAKIAVQLSHDNVVSVIDFGAHLDQCYVVMDYVDGFNLLELMQLANKKEQKLSMAEILFIAKEGSSGLDYIHRFRDAATGKNLNIVHCDISPHNIMVSREGQVKIIDFGVAKSTLSARVQKSQPNMGKARYLSPERLIDSQATQASDIFALGITLWELTTGVRVFENLTAIEVAAKISSFELPTLYEFRNDCPEEWVQILTKATHPDLTKRYQKTSELNRDLSVILSTSYPTYTQEDFRLRIETLGASSLQDETEKLEVVANANAGSVKIFKPISVESRRVLQINPMYVILLFLTAAVYLLSNTDFFENFQMHPEKVVGRVNSLVRTGKSETVDGVNSPTATTPIKVGQPSHTNSPPITQNELSPDERLVRVTSMPTGAYIYVNGYYTQLKTPALAKVSRRDATVILLRMNGYRDATLVLNKDAPVADFKLISTGARH